MKQSVQDETLFAVGEISSDVKPRRGRRRIHADDAARKRAYNRRRAQAYARTRAAEQRAKRWEAKARDLREQLDLAYKRLQRTEESHTRETARLRALSARLQGQLIHSHHRKDELVERSREATAEARTLRQRLARAERVVRDSRAGDRLDKLELRAVLREAEQARDRALRDAGRLRERIERLQAKR